jgi:uncharacterized protein (DUF2236 family)
VSTQAPESAQGAPIGPGSILWENAGRSYNLLVALSGGILQNMHPEVGAGVANHSRVFEDPGERLAASINPILRTIFGPEPEATGREIRDIHKGIKGYDEQGRPYHALKPTTFWWTHATFEDMVAQGINRFSGQPLTRKGREQLNRESVTWYSRYAVTDRPVPLGLDAFEGEWDRVCEDVLEMTPVAEQLIGMFQGGDIDSFINAFGINIPAGKIGRVALEEGVSVLARGGLPETVRERFDIPFSRADELKLKGLDAAVRTFAPKLSLERFYLPVAVEGMQRVEQR